MFESLMIIVKAEDFNASAFLFCTETDSKFFPTPWSSEQWEEVFSHNNHNEHVLFLIKADGNFIGFCLFQLNNAIGFAHLLKIIINPNFQAQNYGRKLLETALTYLKVLCIKKFFLEVETTNTHAIHIYQRCGFKKIHEKKKFYSNGGSALIMTHEN